MFLNDYVGNQFIVVTNRMNGADEFRTTKFWDSPCWYAHFSSCLQSLTALIFQPGICTPTLVEVNFCPPLYWFLTCQQQSPSNFTIWKKILSLVSGLFALIIRPFSSLALNFVELTTNLYGWWKEDKITTPSHPGLK